MSFQGSPYKPLMGYRLDTKAPLNKSLQGLQRKNPPQPVGVWLVFAWMMLPSDSVNEEMIYTVCQIKFQPLRKHFQASSIIRIGISSRCSECSSKCTRKSSGWCKKQKKLNLKGMIWSVEKDYLYLRCAQLGSGSLSTKNLLSIDWPTQWFVSFAFPLLFLAQRRISSPLLEWKIPCEWSGLVITPLRVGVC